MGRFLVLVLAFAAAVGAFEVTKVVPGKAYVKEGGVLNLFCAVDGYYEWCTFRHRDKLCDFEWRKDVWNVTVLECGDYEARIRWTGRYDYYECGIELQGVTPEDAGEWSCSFETYHAGQYRGYGYRTNATMVVDVERLMTTTTTTTTSTTTTTTTTTSFYDEYSDVPESGSRSSPRDESDGRAHPDGDDDDDDDEPAGNVGYIFLAIVLILLVVIVGLLVGLHYTKKLPPAFYGFGRMFARSRAGCDKQQFKPVKADGDDEELKKHPTIVKNGNGNNDNPDTTTVTYAPETETTGEEEEEKKPLQEA